MVTRMDLATAMNARTLGSGNETVILAHGYGGDHSVWDKIVPLLVERYRVVVFDWCFSGLVKDQSLYDAARCCSYDAFAEDLICVVDEMEIKSSVFVGHSMSGMIGCIASIKRPDLFRKLVLVGSSPRFINTEDYEGGFEMPQLKQLFSSIETNFEEWATAFAPLVVDPTDPISAEKFATCLKRMRPEVALPLAKTVFLSDHRDILHNVVATCHLIYTESDLIVPNSVPKYMQTKMINCKCELELIHETTGHFPQLTAPVQFVEVLHRILASDN